MKFWLIIFHTLPYFILLTGNASAKFSFMSNVKRTNPEISTKVNTDHDPARSYQNTLVIRNQAHYQSEPSVSHRNLRGVETSETQNQEDTEDTKSLSELLLVIRNLVNLHSGSNITEQTYTTSGEMLLRGHEEPPLLENNTSRKSPSNLSSILKNIREVIKTYKIPKNTFSQLLFDPPSIGDYASSSTLKTSSQSTTITATYYEENIAKNTFTDTISSEDKPKTNTENYVSKSETAIVKLKNETKNDTLTKQIIQTKFINNLLKKNQRNPRILSGKANTESTSDDIVSMDTMPNILLGLDKLMENFFKPVTGYSKPQKASEMPMEDIIQQLETLVKERNLPPQKCNDDALQNGKQALTKEQVNDISNSKTRTKLDELFRKHFENFDDLPITTTPTPPTVNMQKILEKMDALYQTLNENLNHGKTNKNSGIKRIRRNASYHTRNSDYVFSARMEAISNNSTWKLNEPCENSDQCAVNVEHSICGEELKCVCTEGFHISEIPTVGLTCVIDEMPPQPPVIDPKTPCTSPFEEIAYKMCILPEMEQRLSWRDAVTYCRSKGLELAYDSVVIKARRYFNNNLGESGSRERWPIWVGGKREVSEDGQNHWKWVDGTSVPDFLWTDSRPRSFKGQDNPEGVCMILDGFQAYYPDSLPCHNRRRFVCQRLA